MIAIPRELSTMAEQPFASLKQVDAGVLSVAYAEAGPAGRPAVLLLHGWPYDIHTYAATARRASFRRKRPAMVSSRSSRATSSP